jgi:hypothetical protein
MEATELDGTHGGWSLSHLDVFKMAAGSPGQTVRLAPRVWPGPLIAITGQSIDIIAMPVLRLARAEIIPLRGKAQAPGDGLRQRLEYVEHTVAPILPSCAIYVP